VPLESVRRTVSSLSALPPWIKQVKPSRLETAVAVVVTAITITVGSQITWHAFAHTCTAPSTGGAGNSKNNCPASGRTLSSRVLLGIDGKDTLEQYVTEEAPRLVAWNVARKGLSQ
jgi:hypothetical protein